MNEWPLTRLEDVSEKIGMGPFGSNIKVSTFVESGIPVISGQHLHGFRLLDGGYRFITEEHATQLKNSNVFRGDVIFTHAGTIGQVAFIPNTSVYKRYIISQRQFFLRPKEDELSGVFLTYYFHSRLGRHALLSNASQTGVPSIARPSSHLKNLEIPLPPVEEQEAIAEVLSSLDDKIDLLKRQNKTLEGMAEALFRQWFIEEAQDDWEEVELIDIMDYKEGPGIRNWQYVEGDGTPFINIRLIQDGDIERNNANKISNDEAFGKYEHFLLQEGDMVISTSGTLGRSAIVRESHLPMCLNTSVIRFRPLGCGYAFMYSYLQSSTFLNQLNLMASGSVQKNFGPTHLKQIRVQLPPHERLEMFENASSMWWLAIQKNRDEIDSLIMQRDTLLPKLMSGEVRVNLD